MCHGLQSLEIEGFKSTVSNQHQDGQLSIASSSLETIKISTGRYNVENTLFPLILLKLLQNPAQTLKHLSLDVLEGPALRNLPSSIITLHLENIAYHTENVDAGLNWIGSLVSLTSLYLGENFAQSEEFTSNLAFLSGKSLATSPELCSMLIFFP